MLKNKICNKCGRPILYPTSEKNDLSRCCKPKKFYMQFGPYGCDTGCTGHEVFIEDENGEVLYQKFEFIGYYGYTDKEEKEFLEENLRETIHELGLENSAIEIDYEQSSVVND